MVEGHCPHDRRQAPDLLEASLPVELREKLVSIAVVDPDHVPKHGTVLSLTESFTAWVSISKSTKQAS